MQTTPEMNKLRETLASVIQKHTEANGEYDLLHSKWHEAAAKGDDATADKLEIELERTRRLIQRLELRRSSLEQGIGSAEEVARAAHAARLKATCDSVLGRATTRLADMAPLAAALAKAVDDLESDLKDWKEARYYATQAGAAPEGFSTKANDEHVRELVESLGMARIRCANIAKEMSRISIQ
jgi:chromosome segregation ATPase